MYMKTIAPQRRQARPSLSHTDPSLSRAASRTRAGQPARAAPRGANGGNGHPSASRSGPAIRSDVTAWLAKPKQNLIAGKWVPAASGKTIDVFNPADASVIARVDRKSTRLNSSHLG